MTITVQTFNREFRRNLKISEFELKEIILEKLLEDYECRNLCDLEKNEIAEFLVDTMDDEENNKYHRAELSYVCANRTYIIDCLKYRIEHNHV